MPDRPKVALWQGAVILTLLLLALFHRSLLPGQVLFSNDGPLGIISVKAGELPAAFMGYWHDLNWIGEERPPAYPCFSQILGWFLGDTVLYAKLYAPISLLLLGLCGWILFRSLGFGPWTCLAGAVAFAFNMNAFSNACWGLPSRAVTLASTLLALAALHLRPRSRPWLCYVLAGAMVGHGIMEGFDVGALYSVVVGTYVFFLVLRRGRTPRVVPGAIVGVLVVAFIAAAVSSHALRTLYDTQIREVATTERSEERQWDFATQWSLPVRETLRVAIPGIFGYRMSSLEGQVDAGSYWGAVGRSPGWEISQPRGIPRHSGSGEYAGALVLVLAAFALVQSLRQRSPLKEHREAIWFWAAVAFFSLLLAWGRHGSLFRLFYDTVPLASTVRNPIKFMHIFQLAVLILFGYGLHLFLDHYLRRALKRSGSRAADRGGRRAGLTSPQRKGWAAVGLFLDFFALVRSWWTGLTSPQRKGWVAGGLFLGFFAFVWIVYAASADAMQAHLIAEGIRLDLAGAVHAFSANEVLLALFFFLCSILLVLVVVCGTVSRTFAWLPALACSTLLFADLGRANLPWIQYYDYRETYASNPVVEILRDRAHEHRFTSDLHPFFKSNWLVDDRIKGLVSSLGNKWKQELFPWNNVQILDIVQMPREPILDRDFGSRFVPRVDTDLHLYPRLWELTGTRYLLGMAEAVDQLNRMFPLSEATSSDSTDAPRTLPFGIRYRFDLRPRPGTRGPPTLNTLEIHESPTGMLALIEYERALPRAVRHHNWESLAEGKAVLDRLASPEFDPHQSVVVFNDRESRTGTVASGSATIADYHPRRIVVRTEGGQPGILLYNDRYHPHWKVEVDGKPRPLLRCNYIMRGVRVPAGSSEVVFLYRPPLSTLWVTCISMAAVLVCGLLLRFDRRRALRGSGGPSSATSAP